MNKTLDPAIVRDALAARERCAAKSSNRLEEYFAPLIAAAQPVVPEAFTGQWFVVQSEPQRERAVAGALVGRGFECYLPMRKRKGCVVRGRLHREVEAAMLPGYLFASFNPAADGWKDISHTAGVIDVLGYDIELPSGVIERRPVPVPTRDMYRIRDKEAEYASGARVLRIDDRPLALGALVQIGEGAFVGFLGRVIELLFGRERVKVEIDLFGRPTPLELGVEVLTAV